MAPGHRLPADHPGRVTSSARSRATYDENPGADHLDPPDDAERADREFARSAFGNFVQIRDIISEEMESVMSGAKSGQEAADDAASRGNALLREFEASMN